MGDNIIDDEVPDANYVYSGLLRLNYFPMVKPNLDEIPPLFYSEDFTPDIADNLVENEDGREWRKSGYDQIDYRVTRFNNVTRSMHIPHPKAYATLCKSISDNWEELKHICENEESQIKPKKREDDRVVVLDDYARFESARVIIMESGNQDLDLKLSTCNRYRVSADVSSFFHSIYTHAIPWALVGKQEAKSEQNNRDAWFNQLDKSQRMMKRNETLGIPIGPASSNIITELILSKVDEALIEKDYDFIRFIDDYKCYCATYEVAESFIRDLETELREYLLGLNIKKVGIEELPISQRAGWVLDLANRLPKKEDLTPRKVADYLDYALNLKKHYPEGSVLKFAATSLARNIEEGNAEIFSKYLLSLSFHFPTLLPTLCDIVTIHKVKISLVSLQKLLREQIKHNRSDAISWTLYLMGICQKRISKKLAEEVVETRDCISIATLVALDCHKSLVVSFINELDETSDYDMDQYWLLIHELGGSYAKFDDYRLKSGLEYIDDQEVHFVRPIDDIKNSKSWQQHLQEIFPPIGDLEAYKALWERRISK